jgi:hypothetical protein
MNNKQLVSLFFGLGFLVLVAGIFATTNMTPNRNNNGVEPQTINRTTNNNGGNIGNAINENMPTTNEAIAYLKANGVIIAPSKAVNAGGVSVSGLEMSQNSMRYSWTAEEVDEKLKMIMKNIFTNSIKAANQYGFGDDLVAGANIAGFIKVAEAMLAQGVV